MIVYDACGESLSLGAPLARGGEAIVYRVAGEPEQVAKLYVPAPRPRYDRKLAWMRDHPLAAGADSGGRPPVAWPTGTLHNRRGQFVGYLMPFVPDAVPLLHLYHPRLRAESFPALETRLLYRAARALAATLELLHTAGYVVGDLNESNVLVSADGRVTLIDADSFQIRYTVRGRAILHPCPVGKAEYLPPELQGESLGKRLRLPAHDRFALAVLIFKLLMGGRHPFQGRWQTGGEPPALEHKIAKGWFPYRPHPTGPIAPPPGAPPLDTLHPRVAALFERCFVAGHHRPGERPAPLEWVEALQVAERARRRCFNGHDFGAHLARCHQCGAPPLRFPRWLYSLLERGRGALVGALRLLAQAVASQRYRFSRRGLVTGCRQLMGWGNALLLHAPGQQSLPVTFAALAILLPLFYLGLTLLGGPLLTPVLALALFWLLLLRRWPAMLHRLSAWIGAALALLALAHLHPGPAGEWEWLLLGPMLALALLPLLRLLWRPARRLPRAASPTTLLLWSLALFALVTVGQLPPSQEGAPVGSREWAARTAPATEGEQGRKALVAGVAPLQLNVRTAPGMEAPVLAALPEGTEVELLELRLIGGESWQRIRAGEVEGWVSRQYLQESLP